MGKKIKKVVIAAAGEGTRMLHLTKNKPKHLIKVKKRPFLSYVLDNLLEAGYRELILVVGYKADNFKLFLKDYKSPIKGNYKIKIINQFEKTGKNKYGTACPLMCVKNLIKEENFLFVVGDNLFSVNDLKSFNIEDCYNYIGGIYHQQPQKYGVIISDKGFLKKIVEKPKKNIGNMINTGIYKFTPKVFKKLSGIKKSSRGEYEITDIISSLAKKNQVKIKMLKDFWTDFGNPADIMNTSRILTENGNCKRTTKKSPQNIRMSQ